MKRLANHPKGFRLVRTKRVSVRGTASIEALMAMFVFLIVWAGVLFLGALYDARIRSESAARECAWLYSAGACRQKVEDCETAVQSGEGQDERNALENAGRDDAQQGDAEGGEYSGAVWDKLGEQLDQLFSRRARAQTAEEVARPPLLGGETAEAGARYSLPCNTEPVNVDDLASQLMSALPKDED